MDGIGSTTLPFERTEKSIVYRPECAPDTLYSWKKWAYVKKLARESTPDNILPVPYLYTWRTPVGSFAYGDTLVRIRLWPDTRFVYVNDNERDCTYLNNVYGKGKIVYASHLSAFPRWSEYLICSSAPVMSLSFNQPEAREEVEREIQWIQENKTGDYDLMNGDETFPWSDSDVDHVNWSQTHLAQNLKLMHGRPGRIFFSKGAPNSKKGHFSTRTGSYFNPNIQSAFGSISISSVSLGASMENADESLVAAAVTNECNGKTDCETDLSGLVSKHPALASERLNLLVHWKCNENQKTFFTYWAGSLPTDRKVAISCRGGSPSFDSFSGRIRIIEATLGGTTKGTVPIDITKWLAENCDDKTSCWQSFWSEKTDFNDPAPAKPKRFSVKWSCNPDSPIIHYRELVFPDDYDKLYVDCLGMNR